MDKLFDFKGQVKVRGLHFAQFLQSFVVRGGQRVDGMLEGSDEIVALLPPGGQPGGRPREGGRQDRDKDRQNGITHRLSGFTVRGGCHASDTHPFVQFLRGIFLLSQRMDADQFDTLFGRVLQVLLRAHAYMHTFD